MRSAAEVISPEALPEGEQALLLEDLNTAIPQVLVGHLLGHRIRRHVHQTGLHEVKRQGGEGTAETGNSGGDQVGGQALAEVLVAELLGEIVGGEHTEVHRHGTEDHGETASPESHDALVLGDAEQGVEAVLVATALFDRTETIGLHAHHGDIEGITDHTSESSGSEGRQGGGEESDVTVVALLQLVSENTVQTQTSSTVDGLTHERGRQTSIELHHTFVLNQILHKSHSTDILSLANDLDTSLNQIDGLDL